MNSNTFQSKNLGHAVPQPYIRMGLCLFLVLSWMQRFPEEALGVNASLISNEPSGLTAVTERGFSVDSEDGWSVNSGLRILQDAGAPVSPIQVGEAFYGAGFAGGGAPFTIERGLGSHPTIYLSFWVKFSPNWQGHSSNVNKIFHIWANNAVALYFSATGSGSNPLVPSSSIESSGPRCPKLKSKSGFKSKHCSWAVAPMGSRLEDEHRRKFRR